MRSLNYYIKNNTLPISKSDYLLLFVKDLALHLKIVNKVLVPTDKTNSFIMIGFNKYREKIIQALLKILNLIDTKISKSSNNKL